MKLGEKLRELRKENKLSLRKLSEITGISHTFIADIEKGVLNGRHDTLNKLIDALEKNEEERKKLYRLRDWESTPESIRKEFEYLQHSNINHPIVDMHEDVRINNCEIDVPIYDSVKKEGVITVFGNPVEYGRHYGTLKGYYDEDGILSIDEHDHPFFGLKVSDKSMEPKIPEGSTIIIERLGKPKDQEVGFFFINGEFLIRKIVTYGEISLLKAFNSNYEDIEINKYNDFEVIGKVISAITLF